MEQYDAVKASEDVGATASGGDGVGSGSRPIDLDELVRRLAEPADPADPAAQDRKKRRVLPYITAVRDPRGGLAPLLLPNPETVKVSEQDVAEARVRGNFFLGLLNDAEKASRRRVFERRLADRDRRPYLLAEGDSWFQYPIWLDDVIDHLSADYNILDLSGAGHELRTMVADGEYREYLTYLNGNGRSDAPLRAFLFSGGGNDVVGDQMRAFLKDYDPGHQDDPAWYVKDDVFGARVRELVEAYRAVFREVRKVLPHLPILFHGYDYPIPRPEQGFHIPPKDGWLGAPMRARKIPDGPLQARIVRVMMDKVNAALKGLRGNGIYFVDNRNTVEDLWADELHPTNAGFRAVAQNFRAVMQQAGIPSGLFEDGRAAVTV